MRGIDGEDLADHQPIEQHADVGELADFMLLDPGEKVARGLLIVSPG
jgi:hypothetical protein